MINPLSLKQEDLSDTCEIVDIKVICDQNKTIQQFIFPYSWI